MGGQTTTPRRGRPATATTASTRTGTSSSSRRPPTSPPRTWSARCPATPRWPSCPSAPGTCCPPRACLSTPTATWSPRRWATPTTTTCPSTCATSAGCAAGSTCATRVQGGLTGEDIYAAVQTGARMATVVSGQRGLLPRAGPVLPRCAREQRQGPLDVHPLPADPGRGGVLRAVPAGPLAREKDKVRAKFDLLNPDLDPKDRAYKDGLERDMASARRRAHAARRRQAEGAGRPGAEAGRRRAARHRAEPGPAGPAPGGPLRRAQESTSSRSGWSRSR